MITLSVTVNANRFSLKTLIFGNFTFLTFIIKMRLYLGVMTRFRLPLPED